MRNKTLPRITQVFGFIFAIAGMHSAHAVQITMNVPDCPSGACAYVYTGDQHLELRYRSAATGQHAVELLDHRVAGRLRGCGLAAGHASVC